MAPVEPFDLTNRSYREIYESYDPPDYLRAAYNYGFQPMEPYDFTHLLGLDNSNLVSILEPQHCDSCHPWPCDCDFSNQPGNALRPKTPGTRTGFQPPVPRSTVHRHEASAPQPQEMESSTHAGVTAATATILPPNPYTNIHNTSNTVNDQTVTNAVHDANEDDMRNIDLSQSLFQTPNPTRYANHVELSDVRDRVEGQDAVVDPDSAVRNAANILTSGAHSLGLETYLPLTGDNTFLDLSDPTLAEQRFDDDLHPIGLLNGNNALDMSPQEQSGYCKLQFEDGDFMINSEEVWLGRNMPVFEEMRRKKKQQRRANADLASYKKEPSQPSQHEDADQHINPSSSSQSLEGRPAPPSNVSERGGIVSYQALADVDADMHRKSRQKRRSLAISKSSSAGSVDPMMLHGSVMSDRKTTYVSDGKSKDKKPFIPMHPRIPEHITAISREHLRFFFNFEEACWQLDVMGNGAFINDVYHGRGSLVPRLDHGDEIMVATVKMLFKLPDNVGGSPGISHGTFSQSDEYFSNEGSVLLSSSPVRHLSNAMAAGDSDADDIDAAEVVAHPKSKAKPSRKQEDAKKKKPKKNEPPGMTLPDATKKGKKPKTGDKPSAAAAKEDKPATPPVIEPGSTLEGIPVDELPQKRKGPGRPPKNGFVSKRDKGLVDKKRREYEKRGQVAPAFNDMVNMVRAETKAKEALAKAVQNGEVDPGTSVVPSIETLPTYSATRPTSGPKAAANGHNDTSAEPARKASPKPHKRADKSPSPVAPEETFDEERMKKPNGTYVHIIDEILREHPDQEADLPDIYLRIQKKYPHYKYRVPTAGWQSSVRHNLLQNNRFTEKGKSGKGKFWAIDWDVPIEKEQKKRKAEPSMPRQMMHAQQPGQYGPPQYGNPYANSQAGPSYSSPYAQHGQNAQFGGQNTQRPNGGQPAKPRTLWEIMIDEFIRLHLQYQGTFKDHNAEVIAQKEELWKVALEKLSDAFQANMDASKIELPPPVDQEDAKMLTELKDMFTTDRLREAARQQHHPDQSKPATANQAVENGAGPAGQASHPNGAPIANHTVAGASQMGASVPQPAVQAISQPNNLNSGVPGVQGGPPFAFAPLADSGPAPQPPTGPQQSLPGGAGTKRSADMSDDEAFAKKFKSE